MSQAAAFGRVAKIQDVPSQGVTRLVVELPIEAFKRAVQVFHAMEVLVTLAPADIGKENAYGILGEPETLKPAAGMGAAGADRAGPRGVVAKTGELSAVGPKCARTIRWCVDPAFQEWFSGAYPIMVEQAADHISAARKDFAEAVTTWGVKALLGIDSRKELDTNERAGQEWSELVRIPWMAHQGLDIGAETPF